jgi:hypothetical protein
MYTVDHSRVGVSGWLDDVLQQVAQAGADYVTQEATGVPTYSGAPSYPTNQPGTYSPAPVTVVEAPPTSGWVMPAAIGGGLLLATKLLGLW